MRFASKLELQKKRAYHCWDLGGGYQQLLTPKMRFVLVWWIEEIPPVLIWWHGPGHGRGCAGLPRTIHWSNVTLILVIRSDKLHCIWLESPEYGLLLMTVFPWSDAHGRFHVIFPFCFPFDYSFSLTLTSHCFCTAQHIMVDGKAAQTMLCQKEKGDHFLASQCWTWHCSSCPREEPAVPCVDHTNSDPCVMWYSPGVRRLGESCTHSRQSTSSDGRRGRVKIPAVCLSEGMLVRPSRSSPACPWDPQKIDALIAFEVDTKIYDELSS